MARNFTIEPSGDLLLCANQHSDSVVPFWIDRATGLLSQAAGSLPLGSPACLRFLRSQARDAAAGPVDRRRA